MTTDKVIAAELLDNNKHNGGQVLTPTLQDTFNFGPAVIEITASPRVVFWGE